MTAAPAERGRDAPPAPRSGEGARAGTGRPSRPSETIGTHAIAVALPPAARLLVALALAGALGTAPGAQTWAPGVESAGWTGSGLEGAPVSLLALERSVPGLMYAGLQVAPDGRAGVRKSVDGGKSWITLERGLPAGLAPTAIAVSPDEGRVVLVAGAGGLFRTTNGGATWSEVRQPLPPVTALLFDRADPRVVFAGTELRGNFRSADAGITWRPASAGLPRDRYGATPGAVHLLQHPANPAQLYMGANGFGGVYRSDNGGRSWVAAGEGLPGVIIQALALHPTTPDAVVALTDKGLARSADRGASWQGAGAIPVPDPAAIQFEPGARETLYLASVRGPLFRSTNGGRSWIELPRPGPPGAPAQRLDAGPPPRCSPRGPGRGCGI